LKPVRRHQCKTGPAQMGLLLLRRRARKNGQQTMQNQTSWKGENRGREWRKQARRVSTGMKTETDAGRHPLGRAPGLFKQLIRCLLSAKRILGSQLGRHSRRFVFEPTSTEGRKPSGCCAVTSDSHERSFIGLSARSFSGCPVCR
jgi:hypothetical protein